jgi:hypothetical protein
MADRLDIFLDEVAPPIGEDQASPSDRAWWLQPVQTPDLPTVTGRPGRNGRVRREGAPVDGGDFHARWLRFGK